MYQHQQRSTWRLQYLKLAIHRLFGPAIVAVVVSRFLGHLPLLKMGSGLVLPAELTLPASAVAALTFSVMSFSIAPILRSSGRVAGTLFATPVLLGGMTTTTMGFAVWLSPTSFGDYTPLDLWPSFAALVLPSCLIFVVYQLARTRAV